MPNTTNEPKVITPVVSTEPVQNKETGEVKAGFKIVPVTVEEKTEFAAIVSLTAKTYIAESYKMRTDKDADNESVFQRDELLNGVWSVFKLRCQAAIGKWDSLVTKSSKLPKFAKMGRPEIEAALKVHPKTQDVWKACELAAQHKANNYRLD